MAPKARIRAELAAIRRDLARFPPGQQLTPDLVRWVGKLKAREAELQAELRQGE